ncbi:MAG: precorrin-6Y C5,15-methyltransferase [Neptuniibacter sp. Phe_28]|nr:MAG: precorrin-6Y C5,15-methyltransferase [Neptuniibacter sp. Phe_28]
MATGIYVVGLGVSHEADLSPEALQVLQQVDLVVGSERQLATLVSLLPVGKATLLLPKLEALQELIDESLAANRSVMILASGDPLFYGIGRWFSRHFSAEQLTFYPAVSSLQVACHRLGIALQDVEVLSLHGRPLLKLRTRLRQHQPLLILTDAHSTPTALAQECIACGFVDAKVTVCEALGYPNEKIRGFTAQELVSESCQIEFDPLHVSLLEPGCNRGFLPEFPGIPDQHFVTDKVGAGRGMLTKREVRLSILSQLQVAKGECVWDIGAGCGGVSVELAYWNPNSHIYAIEHHADRLGCLEQNRQRFGVVSNLSIVEGRAPQALTGLPVPDKVFIGGSGGELPALLSHVWTLLPVGGVLLCSAVTEASKHHLYQFYETRLGSADSHYETLQVAVSHGNSLAGQVMYRPSLPVTLYVFKKESR